MDGVALNGAAQNGSDSEQAAFNLPLSVMGNEVSSFPESNSASASQPSTSNENPPLRRKSTELVPSPPPRVPQIKPEDLAKFNIKVRDFAYESTLPRIPAYIPPRQVHIGPRPLKRAREEYDRFYNYPYHSGPSQAVAGPSQRIVSESGRPGSEMKKSRLLEREQTEPVVTSQPLPLFRERGYADLSQFASQAQSSAVSASQPRTPMAPYTNYQSQNSPTQTLPLFEYSQESEPYIDTPLVTPNGSLQWPTTNIAISSMPVSQMDTESQNPSPEILSYSQMGFAPLRLQMDDPSESQQKRIPAGIRSIRSSPLPLFDPSYISPDPFPQTPLPPVSPQRRSPGNQQEDKRPASAPPTEPADSPPPRYNLRKRPPAPAQPPMPRTKSQPQPSRPQLSTMQSTHSKQKSSGSKGSPRSKAIRKPRSAKGLGDEQMIR